MNDVDHDLIKSERWARWAEVIKCRHPWCVRDAIDFADAENADLQLIIDNIKKIHVKMLYGDKSGYGCEQCHDNWPCKTISLITKEM